MTNHVQNLITFKPNVNSDGLTRINNTFYSLCIPDHVVLSRKLLVLTVSEAFGFSTELYDRNKILSLYAKEVTTETSFQINESFNLMVNPEKFRSLAENKESSLYLFISMSIAEMESLQGSVDLDDDGFIKSILSYIPVITNGYSRDNGCSDNEISIPNSILFPIPVMVEMNGFNSSGFKFFNALYSSDINDIKGKDILNRYSILLSSIPNDEYSKLNSIFSLYVDIFDGVPSSYSWNADNIGSKWGVYSVGIAETPNGYIDLSYETAWSPLTEEALNNLVNFIYKASGAIPIDFGAVEIGMEFYQCGSFDPNELSGIYELNDICTGEFIPTDENGDECENEWPEIIQRTSEYGWGG